MVMESLTGVSEFIKENPILSGALGAGVVIGGAAVTTKIIKAKSSKKRKRKRVVKKNGRCKRVRRNIRRKSGRRTPRTAGKGKDRSTRRIRYTKKGQPYVIMKSGKARFIKKSSAKTSHKLKGGRY